MAVLGNNTDNFYVISDFADVPTDWGHTFACWHRNPFNALATNPLMFIADIDRRQPYAGITVWNNGSDFVARCSSVPVTGAGRNATGTVAVNDGNWHHICGNLNSSNISYVWTDGADKQSDFQGQVDGFTGLDNIAVGTLYRDGGTGLNYFGGEIAEAAWWDVTLTDAEVALLAKGYSPRFIRPDALKFYQPMWNAGSDLQNLVASGQTLVENGSPATIDHSPIIYPVSGFLGSPSAAPLPPPSLYDFYGGVKLEPFGNPVAAAHPSIIYPTSGVLGIEGPSQVANALPQASNIYHRRRAV